MDYLSLLSKASSPAPEADLARLEAMLGAVLPSAYADFLRQSNGGVFRAELIDIPGPEGESADVTVLNYMFSTNGPDYNLFEEYEALRKMDRIPVQALPIADDPSGNLFVLSLEEDSTGAVYFWDHEREPGDGSRIADFPNMVRVASDFAAFAAALREDR